MRTCTMFLSQACRPRHVHLGTKDVKQKYVRRFASEDLNESDWSGWTTDNDTGDEQVLGNRTVQRSFFVPHNHPDAIAKKTTMGEASSSMAQPGATQLSVDSVEGMILLASAVPI